MPGKGEGAAELPPNDGPEGAGHGAEGWLARAAAGLKAAAGRKQERKTEKKNEETFLL